MGARRQSTCARGRQTAPAPGSVLVTWLGVGAVLLALLVSSRAAGEDVKAQSAGTDQPFRSTSVARTDADRRELERKEAATRGGASCADDLAVAARDMDSGRYGEAVAAACRVSSGGCLLEGPELEAKEFLAMEAVRVTDWVMGTASVPGGALIPVRRAVRSADALAKCDPGSWKALQARVALAEKARAVGEAPSGQVGRPVPARAVAERAPAPRINPPVRPSPEQPPVRRPAPAAARTGRPVNDGPLTLALDVWQSAWGDFARIGDLVTWARRNRLTDVFLNPGLGINAKPETRQKALSTLGPMVRRLRADAGVRVSFLYAELNYPIGDYAALLAQHPELGIDRIIDDSEFTDAAIDRFIANRDAVRRHRLVYSAFVTVEQVGNSGVSEATRRWAIEELDEVILMSYFSCDVESQRVILEPLLSYADEKERVGKVRVAILLGGKQFGREVSCERALDGPGLVSYLAALDSWARSHPSYAGIVLETNLPLPERDVLSSPSPGAVPVQAPERERSAGVPDRTRGKEGKETP